MTATTDIVMPKLGLTMVEGTIAEWLVPAGAAFDEGAVLAVVETDKIANEIQAAAAGTMLAHLFAEGAVVPVGEPIARVSGGAGSAEPSLAPPPPEPLIEQPPAPERPAPPPRPVGDRVVATPYARKLAYDHSIDLRSVASPDGRLTGADIQAAARARQDVPRTAAQVALLSRRVDVAPLMRLLLQISAARGLELTLFHAFVLAVLDSRMNDSDAATATIGIARSLEPASSAPLIDGDLTSLSGIARSIDRARNRAPGDGGPALVIYDRSAHPGETATILPADDTTILTLGGVERSGEADANTAPAIATITLCAVLDGQDGSDPSAWLARIAAALDNPLLLLS